MLTTAVLAGVAAAAFAAPTYDRHGRIVNGVQTSNADVWPWFVSLQSNTGRHFCGGSLIRADLVLTAAHCVDSGSTNFRVVVGEFDLDSTADGIVANVERVIVHPSFDSSSLVNDIAILKIDQCISANDVTPVQIDSRGETALLADLAGNSGQDAVASIIGLGTTSSGGSSPRVLREARQTVLSHSACSSRMNGVDQTTMICGDTTNPDVGFTGNSNANVDTCQGDSGGPFVTLDNGAYVLTGLTSWGFGCAGSTPGVYTRVSRYSSSGTNWVASTIASQFGAACTPPPPPPPFTQPLSCSETGVTVQGDTRLGQNTGFQSSREQHYTFTVPASGGDYEFSTCNQANYDTWLHVVSASDPTGTPLVSLDDTPGCSGFSTRISDILSPGDYILIVEGYRGSEGTYSLTSTCIFPGTPSPTQSPTFSAPTQSPTTSAPTPTPPTDSPTTSAPTQSPTTSAPTQSPTTSSPTPANSGPAFSLVNGGNNGECELTQVNGAYCITDGAGRYGRNEDCSYTVNRQVTLDVQSFRTRNSRDRLTVNGQRYSGRNGPDGVVVAAGSTIRWETDRRRHQSGYVICEAP